MNAKKKKKKMRRARYDLNRKIMKTIYMLYIYGTPTRRAKYDLNRKRKLNRKKNENHEC